MELAPTFTPSAPVALAGHNECVKNIEGNDREPIAVVDGTYMIKRIGYFNPYPVHKFLVYEGNAAQSPDDQFTLEFKGIRYAVVKRAERTHRFELHPGVFLTELDFFEVLGTTIPNLEIEDEAEKKCLALDWTKRNNQFEIKIKYAKTNEPSAVSPWRVFALCGKKRRSALADMKVTHHVVFFKHKTQYYSTMEITPDNMRIEMHTSMSTDIGVDFGMIHNLRAGDYISLSLSAHDIGYFYGPFDESYKNKIVEFEDGSAAFFLTPDIQNVHAVERIVEFISHFLSISEELSADAALLDSENTLDVLLVIGDRPQRCVLHV